MNDEIKRIITISSKEYITRLEGAFLLGLLNGIPSKNLRNSRDKTKHYYNLIYGNLSEFCISTGPNKGLYKTENILSYYNKRYGKNITLLDLKDKDYVEEIIKNSTQDINTNTNYEQITNIEESNLIADNQQQTPSYNELKVNYDEVKEDLEYYKKIYNEIKEKYDLLNNEFKDTKNLHNEINYKLQLIENDYRKLKAECTLKDLEIDSLRLKIAKIEKLYLDENKY